MALICFVSNVTKKDHLSMQDPVKSLKYPSQIAQNTIF